MPGKDDGTKKIAPVDEPIKAPAKPDTPIDDGKGKKDELILGKYKSAEDLAKAHTELEGRLGSQGQELGALRNEVAQHRAAQAEAEKGKRQKQEPVTDYDAKLNEIYEKVETGDISVGEALKQSNALTAEMTMATAVQQANKATQDILIDKDAESAEKEWHKTYPDYAEVVASGQLQPYIDKNPILIDETVAYFQYKADQRFEDGKAEAERIAKGAAEADTVVKEPGVMTPRTPTRQEPLSEDKMLAAQMETLKKMRGQT